MAIHRAHGVAMVWLAFLLCGVPTFEAAAQDSGEVTVRDLGDIAPDFSLKTPEGKEVSLEDFRGKVIVLSFWECYSDVCFAAARILDRIFRRYPQEKFVLITNCIEVPEAMVKDKFEKLLKSCSVGQVILIDENKRVNNLYGVEAAPTTFLINREMVIWGIITSIPDLRNEDFKTKVDSLISEIP